MTGVVQRGRRGGTHLFLQTRQYPHFYPRDAMLARVFATATCPSVRLSHAGIVPSMQSESRIVKCTPSDSPMTLVSGKV